ncbi:MAG: phage antirepressor KilAC domain-containing protein [Bacteroidales bacterium]|nr:phage antirepressor KilAC domain-containing protein [Bacteroidales bacterium]
MNNSIQIFNNKDFGTIRTMVNENGETFFVAKDVATALGYTKTRNAVAAHVSKEDRATALIQGPTSDHASNTVVINESGLYALIFGSKLPSAQAFKRWVTSEVLPQIRRTGGYIPTKDSRTGEALSETQIIKVAENIMQKTIAQENRIADGCFSATEVAKTLELEVKEMNLMLVGAGVIFWNGSRYKLCQKYAERGLAQDRNFHYYGLGGVKKQRPYLVWTAAGVDFIKELLSNN